MDVATDPKDLLRKQADEIETLKTALSKLERENKRLSDELALLLRQLFHKKSERLDADQLRLFAEQLLGEQGTAPAPEEGSREDRFLRETEARPWPLEVPGAPSPRDGGDRSPGRGADLPGLRRDDGSVRSRDDGTGSHHPRSDRRPAVPPEEVRLFLRTVRPDAGAPAVTDREVQVRDLGLRAPDSGEVR